jgi:hypothetical protein
MDESVLVPFVDRDSGDEAFAIVKVFPDGNGLVLSFKNDGEIQVVLNQTDCRRLVDALQRAIDAKD